MSGRGPLRGLPDSPKAGGRTWRSTLLFAVLAGAGGACAGVRLTGELSPPAADISPFLVRTFELRNQDSNAPAARAFALDPEWTRLALPASDGTVRIINVASGESDGPPLDGGIRTGFMTFDYEPFTFTFTSTGKRLVWSFGKKVVAWQVESREILLEQEVDEVTAGVSVAPGGRFLAWSTDRSTVVWDMSSRGISTRLDGRLCGFSPDGRLLALAGSLWDYERGQPLKKPAGGSIWDLGRGQPLVEDLGGLCQGFSPDGRYVVVEGPAGTALWDVAGARALPAFRRLTDPVRGMIVTRPVWNADGRFLAFTNRGSGVEVWDLEAVPPTHRVLSEAEREQPWTRGRCLPSPLTSLLLSHDGGLLSDACMVTDLWDLSRPTSRRMLRTGYLPASLAQEPSVLSRDGRTLAYTWGSGRHLLGGGGFGLWDVASGRAAGPRIEVRDFARMQISPDGRLLATSGRGRGADGKSSFVVQLWNVDALRASGEGEIPDPPPAGAVTDRVN